MAKYVRLDLTGLRTIRANVRRAADVAVVSTAFAIRDDAVVKAEKDTTYLANSIHIVSSPEIGINGYSQAKELSETAHRLAAATGKTPKGVRIGPRANYNFFPELTPDMPGQVWVVVGAMHGIANEEGVHGRTPFLGPAVRDNRVTLTAQIRKSFNGLSVRAEITRTRETK